MIIATEIYLINLNELLLKLNYLRLISKEFSKSRKRGDLISVNCRATWAMYFLSYVMILMQKAMAQQHRNLKSAQVQLTQPRETLWNNNEGEVSTTLTSRDSIKSARGLNRIELGCHVQDAL